MWDDPGNFHLSREHLGFQALARHLGGGGLSEHKPSSFLSQAETNVKADIFWESL